MLSTLGLNPEGVAEAERSPLSRWAWSWMTVAWKGAEGSLTSGKGMEGNSELFSASDSNPGLLGGASDASSAISCRGRGEEEGDTKNKVVLNVRFIF